MPQPINPISLRYGVNTIQELEEEIHIMADLVSLKFHRYRNIMDLFAQLVVENWSFEINKDKVNVLDKKGRPHTYSFVPSHDYPERPYCLR